MAHTGILILLFLVFALTAGVFTRYFLRHSKIPYTVALLLIGLLCGLLGRYGGTSQVFPMATETLTLVAEIDPHLILFLFLPALIFESAFAMEAHLFRRMLSQISLLAVPGLILATVATAVLIQWLFPWEWTWPVALMFGALISANDPVAVVALLKELSSRKRLETLLEGESLLNDGTAIVLFTLFYGIVTGVSHGGGWLTVCIDFLWVVCIGMLVGWGLAVISLQWLSRVFNDPLIEIIVTVVGAYLAFLLAEAGLHVSGVVAVVTIALMYSGQGRTRISPEVQAFLHQFWEMLAHIFNTVIFLLVGIIIAERVRFDDPQAWLALAVLYVGIQLIRGATIMTLSPLLARIGVGITREKAVVLVWGGIRGAVAMALALSVAQNQMIPQAIRDQVLFLTAGIVVLTIVINGSTIPALLRYLGLDHLPAAKQVTVNRAQLSIDRKVYELSEKLQTDDLLKHANWLSVRSEMAGVHLYEASKTGSEAQSGDQGLIVAYKRRLLESERKHYWNQFEEGVLSPEAAAELVNAVEHALDDEPLIGPRRHLLKSWKKKPENAWLDRLPIWGKYFHQQNFLQMVSVYNTARGFLQAQKAMLSVLESFELSNAMKVGISKEIAKNISEAERQIKTVRQHSPETVQALETFTVTRLLLNRERESIAYLQHTGVLDVPEAEKLVRKVEEAMNKQDRYGVSPGDSRE